MQHSASGGVAMAPHSVGPTTVYPGDVTQITAHTAQQQQVVTQAEGSQHQIQPTTAPVTSTVTVQAHQPVPQGDEQTQLEKDKRAILRHPLFPLLALLFEKCEQATQSTDPPTSASFDVDIEAFVRQQDSERKPFFTNDQETDNLVVKAIQVLRIHLLELEKVNELCKDFCNRYITCLKNKMNSENLLRSDVLTFQPVGQSPTQTQPPPLVDTQSAQPQPHHQLQQQIQSPSLQQQQQHQQQQQQHQHHQHQHQHQQQQQQQQQQVQLQSVLSAQDAIVAGASQGSGAVLLHQPPPQLQQQQQQQQQIQSAMGQMQSGMAAVMNPAGSGGIVYQQVNMVTPQGVMTPQGLMTQTLPPGTVQIQAAAAPTTPQTPTTQGVLSTATPVIHGSTPISQIGFNPEATSVGQHSAAPASTLTSAGVMAQSVFPDNGLGEDLMKGRRNSKRGVLPKHATNIMRSWLFQHIVHPYPTEDEKRQIAGQTSLTLLQVNNWFINARRRILQPMLEASNPNTPKAKKNKSQSRPTQRFWPESLAQASQAFHQSQQKQQTPNSGNQSQQSTPGGDMDNLDSLSPMMQVVQAAVSSPALANILPHGDDGSLHSDSDSSDVGSDLLESAPTAAM